MLHTRQLKSQHNQLCIYIDSYDVNSLQGRASFGFNQKVIAFENIVSLIIAFDYYIDNLDFPQASTERRIFNGRKLSKKEVLEMLKGENLQTKDKENAPKKEKAVFIVEVDYRQNATWQGSVFWVEGNEKKQFRSSLELIMLLESAVNGTEAISFTNAAKKA